ncbi:MAG: TaqI-like C-terminal specificity domain-containing protein, partial [Bacillota bacterium]|nr:TaqI-like C-terminal specificity domain-containing protein [Bacillota bacterium]
REVIHEDKVKVSGSIKAPDYSFRLVGGKRLFFVEAKKPSISVKEDIQPAYQVRRYGWSAKLPISIITDFEEFSIYDCTKKPKPNDKPPVARIKYLSFRDYIKEFDFLWDTFSKEQVLKGSFDKFLQSDTHKKGTATVDKDFLESLDRWRTYLAVSISWNNKTLDEEEINYVVQQTIDRIIFLRIAEDRGVEPYGTLHHATKLGNLYQNLFELFQKADQKYNSGLFDFKRDKISQDVVIDNKVIKTIINELYYPECPYEFSVLSVEILGSAYEQFLGKVIRITPAHHAKIEEKPEVRKAGGVYYTPQYIVDYIVKSTVGKLIEGKTPKEISKIKILDPACGSGSFLIGAFQYLLDYHKDYYSENGKPSKGKKDNPLTPEGNLTSAEKKRILLNNVFGVDLDINAVEVTKLSLLIKCLEGETEASIKQQLSIWNERVLPTLDNNIKSGNSLIDIDFYSAELDFGFEKKIRPFKWESAFPIVFETSGFDIVLGNPPYGAAFSKEENDYFLKKYTLQDYQLDSYLLFIEKSLLLLKTDSLLGFIIPNTWLLNLTAKKIRSYLFNNVEIKKIIHFQIPVFEQAVVDTEIMIFKKSNPSDSHKIQIEVFDKRHVKTELNILQRKWIEQNGAPVNILDNEKFSPIKEKTSKLPILDSICKITQGTKPFQVGKGTPKQTRQIVEEKPYVSEKKIDDSFRPLLRGSLMNRYQINWNNDYWIKFGDWLAEPRYTANYDAAEKIIIRQTSDHLNATLDNRQFIVRDNLYTIVSKNPSCDLKYILGLLNSSFLNWYYQNILNPEKGEALAQVKRGHIANLPIKTIDPSHKNEIESEKEIITLVEQLLELNMKIKNENLESNISPIKSRIEYCESRINEIVYILYGLTKDEINILNG